MFFVVSILISLAGSVFVAFELGFDRYAPVALVAFLTLYAIFEMNERAHRKAQKLGIVQTRAAIDFLTHLGLALYLAATWPSLPLIVWLGRWTRGDERLPAGSSDRRS